MNLLPDRWDPKAICDHIRMLDGDSNPKALLRHSELLAEFGQAHLGGGQVSATVRFSGSRSRGGND